MHALLTALALTLAPLQDSGAEAPAAVSAERLARTVQLLASDAFEGRLLGSEGSRAAARYMAAELEALGLEPLGATAADGRRSFLAPLTLRQRRFTAPPELRLQTADGVWHTLVAGVDFALVPTGLPTASGELAVRSVRDEEALAREATPDAAFALLGPPARTRRWLDAPALEGRRPSVVLVPGNAAAGRPIEAGDFGPPQRPSAEPVAAAARVALHGPWVAVLEAGDVRALTLDPNLVDGPLDDANVVALLRGVGTPERPELAEEAIVVTAHRDHIGVQRVGAAGATAADRIANGADDDASGCAVGLELARCLAAGPRPARSVLFVFVTGEEAGMLGSRDYVDAPAWPLERTVANLNLEMLGVPDPLTLDEAGQSRPWLTGFERSNLGAELVALGLGVAPDPRPRMNFFVRSDNVSFAKVGIVAHTLSTGGENPNYHQVRDEWHTLDYAHMARCGAVGLGALRALASGALTPRWNEGEPKLGR